MGRMIDWLINVQNEVTFLVKAWANTGAFESKHCAAVDMMARPLLVCVAMSSLLLCVADQMKYLIMALKHELKRTLKDYK